MTYKEIQELNALEPFCFEDHTQEQWYKCGLVEGAKIGYEQAQQDLMEKFKMWVAHNGYTAKDGDMTEVEKELERFIASGKATTKVNSGRFQTTHIDPLKIAKHFAQWQREQMMKDAVEGYIEGDQRNQEDEPYDVYAVSDSLDTTKFKIGDKVKVIIIKE